MESCEGGDDQGSGWLQVKKKHRSSSKFSLHSLVKYKNDKSGAHLDTVHDPGNVAISTSLLSEDVKKVHSDDKSIECPKSPLPINVEALNHKPGTDPENINNSGVHLKIKWGDLDDEILNTHQSTQLLPSIEEFVEEDCKEVNEVFPDARMESLEGQFSQITESKNDEKIISTANEESSVTQTPINVYEAPSNEGDSRKVVFSLDPIDQNKSYSSKESEENDENRTGGSKERFRQRLWCFLFENLNRAIDELYLLCELECDVEQVREAILVLEEAESDFRELNSRVEEFEKVKKPPNFALGASLTMKSDHRRPHALSWEVRRMTTSPHRADILSSSLEAFRKIQQERATNRVKDSELLGSNCTFQEKEGLQINTRRNVKYSKTSDSTMLKDKKSTDLGKYGSNISRLPSKASSEPEGRNVNNNIKGRNGNLWKKMDAWKEKRNWEDILANSNSARKSAERARNLHDKLISPDKRKKSSLDLKKEAEEKHARATRIRNELENERVQKLQKVTEKLNRANELQAVKNLKMREGISDRHKKSESRHEAFLAQVVRRAGDESSKVNEVRFITSLNEENKKLMLRQKLHDSELRRAEKLQILKIKQKEDMLKEEAVLERRKLIEAEKLQRLAEISRKKEEAQIRREEERKALNLAREAKAIENMRRKEIRAKAQQEEAELLALKLAERLRESEQRRNFYLEQIRERASIRDQSSPLVRRSLGRLISNGNSEDLCLGNSLNVEFEHVLKKRIKKIRQRLMALKYEYVEPSIGSENRNVIGSARAKIGRWLQELQKLRQARKAGTANFGLISAEMIKFFEGKEAELHASRQSGLLDFIASALPASHTSKPEACQVTIYLLRLLRVVLSLPENRAYFLAQNLIPPIIPMLVAAIENYIKIVASSSPQSQNSEIFDGFLWTVGSIIGHESSDERQMKMQDGLIELIVAYKVIHRLRDLFALYDRPQIEGSPFPESILLSINLLTVLTSRYRNISSIDWEFERMDEIKDEDEILHNKLSDEADLLNESLIISQNDVKISKKNSPEKESEQKRGLKQPLGFLLSAIAETGLVCLPSMLTAVLLQANNRLSSDQSLYVLPSNFEEVATGVLKVLNNLAQINMTFIQKMLARSDLKMEFFHVMSFILSYCTSKWGVATDQNGLLLLESLSLLGYFSLFHSENQAVLRWGKNRTILHKVCDLPFTFFSDPELMPILAGTLVAACFGCEQNKGVIQQELSMDMFLSLLKSCKNNSHVITSVSSSINSQRSVLRLNNRVQSQKNGGSASNRNNIKMRNQRDNKTLKLNEEMSLKQNQSISCLTLYSRFPESFIYRAEQFFCVEIP